jgi:hypothetical protein
MVYNIWRLTRKPKTQLSFSNIIKIESRDNLIFHEVKHLMASFLDIPDDNTDEAWPLPI